MGQIWKILVFGIVAGTDNFQAATSVGLLPMAPSNRWFWVLSFGFWEGFMTLLGALVGGAARRYLFGADATAGALAFALSGAATLYLVIRGRDTGLIANSRWIAFSTPFLLSLDNLAAGAGLGASGISAWRCAAEIGFICALMSLAGLLCGGWGQRIASVRNIRWMPAAAGAWMMLAAGAHCWIQ